MTSAEKSFYSDYPLNDTIMQTLGYKEAVLHYVLYQRYQQALERKELFRGRWFHCSIDWLEAQTDFSEKEINKALRKLWRKKWINRDQPKSFDEPIYIWRDESTASVLETVPFNTKKLYSLLSEEYRYLNHFHNYIIDGWFEYSIKRLGDEMDMFYVEMRPHFKKLKKHQLIEQKVIGQTTYFRLAEKNKNSTC